MKVNKVNDNKTNFAAKNVLVNANLKEVGEDTYKMAIAAKSSIKKLVGDEFTTIKIARDNNFGEYRPSKKDINDKEFKWGKGLLVSIARKNPLLDTLTSTTSSSIRTKNLSEHKLIAKGQEYFNRIMLVASD